jgi:hypothetical protein
MCGAIFCKMFSEYVEKQLARKKESEHAVVEEKEILLPNPSAP